ncbi:MAG: class I SAM-dependent methyltransferase [Acidimicrobiia bacterium]|nr:class I SAM-dependent methyltransferase [Acidimicrobiia bacterium]
MSVDPTTRMARYLAARTAFFDRVVVSAIDGGITQVVVAAAGYDGRALRYARPGVRWFELDHPDTQADKRAALDRLGIETSDIGFAAADFVVDDVAAALAEVGHDRSTPTLFTVEGVAVYLDRPVLEALLRGLRRAAAPGSRLAISLSVEGGAGTSATRAAFRSGVARLGEPARTTLTVDEAGDMISATGWEVTGAGSERGRSAGLVVLVASDPS